MRNILLSGGLVAGVCFLAGCNMNSPVEISQGSLGGQKVADAAMKLEAENAALSGGAKKNTNHTGYSGTGFVDGYFNVTGAQTTFTIYAPVAGDYQVTLTYSAGNGDCSNIGYYVNGVKLGMMQLYKTTDWNTWSNVGGGSVPQTTLHAGNNTISYRAESSSPNCINLDYIMYQPMAQKYPTVNATSGAGGTTSPAGLTYYYYSNDVTYWMKPNAGYQVYDVVLDLASQKAIDAIPFVYLMWNHTISASFIAVPPYNLEAENATLSGGAKKNTNHSGYSGSGFVDGYANVTGAQTLFNQGVASTGTYFVTLRYSAGNGASTNTGLYVNGGKIKNITCPATANWDSWANETEKVTLNGSANNTIAYRSESSANTCINPDKLTVSPVITITTQPYSTITCDAYGYFNVAAQGQNGETLSYQWYLNNTALTNNGYLVNGATSAYLTLYNYAQNMGVVYCKVTGATSGGTMNTVKVNFQKPSVCN